MIVILSAAKNLLTSVLVKQIIHRFRLRQAGTRLGELSSGLAEADGHFAYALGRGVEVQRVVDVQVPGHFHGVLVGADVGEGPALLTETGNKSLDGFAGILLRGVLIAVGDDGGHHAVVLVNLAFQGVQGLAHGVVKGRAAAGAIVFAGEVLHLFDNHPVPARLDTGDAVSFEGDDGHVVLLVGEILAVLADAGKDFVDAREGLVVDGGHAAALVKDDYVVDVHGALCFGFRGKGSKAVRREEIAERLSWF